MAYNDPIFPLQLRGLRALLDLNQKQLADLAGVSETLVYRIEKGEPLGQVKKLEQLQAALLNLGARFSFDGQSFGIALHGPQANRLIEDWLERRRAQLEGLGGVG